MSDPTQTPNVVIEDPNTRRNLGRILYIVSVVSAAVGLTVVTFPELSGLGVDVNRIVILANALVSLVSGAFGLGVTLPNVPKR